MRPAWRRLDRPLAEARREVTTAARHRPFARVRAWLGLALLFALVLAGLGFAQAIVERYAPLWDLTPRRDFSLSDVSLRALERLDGPLRITAFHRRGERQTIADLLDRYAAASPDVEIEILDLDRHPGRARELGVRTYGVAVLGYADRTVSEDGRTVVVGTTSEATMTGGVLRLLRGRPTRVYFVSGHGERSIDDATSSRGFASAHRALEEAGHDVAIVDFGRAVGSKRPTAGSRERPGTEVPADADLLVLAGPSTDFLDAEIGVLDAWLDAGGSLVALLEPTPVPKLRRLLSRRGIDAPLEVIVDPSNRSLGLDAFVIRVPVLGSPVADGAAGPALFPVACPILAGPAPAGMRARAFAETHAEAQTRRDVSVPNRVGLPAEEAERVIRRGPVPVAAAAWSEGPGPRIVVIGDADFAANGYLDLLANRSLLVNAVAWSISPDAVVGAVAAEPVSALQPVSPLLLTANEGRILFAVVCLVVPGLVLTTGLFVVVRRRRKG